MRIACLIVSIFLTLNLIGQKLSLPSFPSDLLDEKIISKDVIGKPKTILEENYAYNDKTARMEFQAVSKTYSYKDGNLVSVLFTKEDEDYLKYNFDAKGRILKQERYDPESIISKVEYQYLDQKGQAKELVYRNTGTVHSERVVTYDAYNRMIQREEFSGTGQLERYWTYTYNQQGQLEKESYYDHEKGGLNKLNEVKTYTSSYTEDGKVLKIATYVADQLLSVQEHYQNKDSTSFQKTMYLQNGMPSERQLKIEKDSLRVIIKGFYSHNDTNRFSSRFREIYIEGDKIEYESRTLGGTKVDRYATFYEYDEIGNWIKKTIYTNGVPSHVIQRFFRY